MWLRRGTVCARGRRWLIRAADAQPIIGAAGPLGDAASAGPHHPTRCGEAFARGRVRFPVDLLLADFVGAATLGSALRSAECAGVERVFYSGARRVTDPRVAKVSLGSEDALDVRHITDPTDLLAEYAAWGGVVVIRPDAAAELRDVLHSRRAALPPRLLLVFPPDVPAAHPLPAFALPASLSDTLRAIPHTAAAAAPSAIAEGGGQLGLSVTGQVAVSVYEAAAAYDAAGGVRG